MLLQYLIIGAVIAVSLAYLGKRAVTTWRGRCSSGCGCKPAEVKKDDVITAESLTILKR
jgi:hypothetical protein